jgi:hypothetical protein
MTDSTYTLNWKGEEVNNRVRAAVLWGMDSVMTDCVSTAKSTVHVKTSILQGSIQMRPAQQEGDIARGYWGSFAVKYAIWVEQGTEPHVIFPKTKKALFWPGADHPVRFVLHPGNPPYPFLVPAAEQHYPSLGLRIQMQAGAGT